MCSTMLCSENVKTVASLIASNSRADCSSEIYVGGLSDAFDWSLDYSAISLSVLSRLLITCHYRNTLPKVLWHPRPRRWCCCVVILRPRKAVCLRIRSNLLTHCTNIRHIILSVPSSVSFSDSDVDWTFKNRTCLISPHLPPPVISSSCQAALVEKSAVLYSNTSSRQHIPTTRHLHWSTSPVCVAKKLCGTDSSALARWTRPTASQRALWLLRCSGMRRRGVCTNLPTFRKKQLPPCLGW